MDNIYETIIKYKKFLKVGFRISLRFLKSFISKVYQIDSILTKQLFNIVTLLKRYKTAHIREETPVLKEDVLGSTATDKTGVSTK